MCRTSRLAHSTGKAYRVRGTEITHFLSGFAELRKATIASSCPFARPSIRMEQLASRWTDCHEIRCSDIFRKSVEKMKV